MDDESHLLKCGIVEKEGHVELDGSGLLRYNLHSVKSNLKKVHSSLNFDKFI